MSEKTLLITNKQVKAHMTLDKAIKCVENTWRWHGEGQVVMPPKITTDMSSLGVEGWFNSMPSYLHPVGAAGMKLVGGYLNNRKRGMPFIKANVLLTDPDSGILKALVCGDYISDARTGAQPAVAIKYLAASTDVITIIGAGLQAFYSVSCIAKLHKIKELRVCDIRPEAREKFASFFPDADFKIIPYDSNEAGCRGADIIITVTTADAHLVDATWCKPGCLVLTMGSYTETAENVVTDFDKLFIDHMAQGLHRGNFKVYAEKGIVTPESFEAELPYVVAGKASGRVNPTDRILCELVGMGSPDLCIANEVYNAILESGEECLSVDMMGE